MHNYVHKFLESTVGAIFGKDITCREPVHRCDDHQPGVIMEFGRTGVKFLKKFMMPCGLCAAVPVLKPVNPPEQQPKPCHTEKHSENLIKPSELPIYSTEEGYTQMPCTEHTRPTIVEENIRKVRVQLQELRQIGDNVSQKVTTTVDQFKYIIDYLQDEANILPRAGAVGIGGLSGLILGLRGGLFKKFFYTTTGASIVGVICFPKEAKEALNAIEHYGQISYNFIYGVKPGDSKGETSFKEYPLVKSVLESEYFQFLTKPFEKASEKKEENPTASKS
ncbi:MICOS complex subunit 26/27 isoform X1 [Megalopta genalis]|uniref:MICOS complex subunit 26/27 isoform X1 n=1 Tax=Megalopta genalis TaxID=115081 RepID=UPI003FD1F4D3